MAFTRSSHSFPVGCVEVDPEHVYGGKSWVAVKNSRLGEQSPILRFTDDEWRAFIKGVKEGEFG